MTNKPNISLSIMPTYRCHNGCEYCYLKHEPLGYVKYDSDALPRKIYKRLKELSAKYNIHTVELYGGNLNEYDFSKLKTIVDAYRCYCKDDRIMIHPTNAAILGFEEKQVNMSINPERPDFLQNIMELKKFPQVGVITVVTAKLMSNPIPDILDWVKSLRGNFTLMSYSNYSPNYPVPYVSNYEYCAFMIRFLEYYLKHRNEYKFKLTNILMLKDCINRLYSPAMNNNIFLEPSGHFACVDFDLNGNEYFHIFKNLEAWEERCKQEYFDRQASCGSCDYYNTCMAEHYIAPNQQKWYVYENGDICNGYKPLVDWAKENLSGLSY